MDLFYIVKASIPLPRRALEESSFFTVWDIMGKEMIVDYMQLVWIYILSTLPSQQRGLREAQPGEERCEGNGERKGSGGSA